MRIAAADLDRAAAIFAGNLLEQTGCEGRCVVAEAIHIPGYEEEVLLLRDVKHDAWIHARVVSKESTRDQALCSATQFVERVTGNSTHVLLRGSLAARANTSELRENGLDLIPMPDNITGADISRLLSQAGIDSGPLSGREVARLLKSSEAEFAYFTSPDLRAPRDIALDVLTTLICRAALRGFARRLMAFQTASPEHLYQNFFEGIGTVRNLPERIEVELPHCPLSLVLQLSGLDRQTFAVPWLEGEEVCLLPPRE